MITLYADKNMGKKFRDRIKQRRQELGLSLRKVCETVKNEDGKPISVSYLNDIEQGHRKPPSASIVAQLATALDLPKDELLDLADKPDPEIEEAMKNPETRKQIAELYRKYVKGN